MTWTQLPHRIICPILTAPGDHSLRRRSESFYDEQFTWDAAIPGPVPGFPLPAHLFSRTCFTLARLFITSFLIERTIIGAISRINPRNFMS